MLEKWEKLYLIHVQIHGHCSEILQALKKDFENKKFKICAVESSKCKLGKLAKLLAIYRSIAMLDYSNILEGRAVYNKIKNQKNQIIIKLMQTF